MTRITYTGRDHDTARHNPTYLEEDIMPMEEKDEFNGPLRWVTWTVAAIVLGIFWYALICFLVL
jgi:hypothetical protein